MIVRMSYWQCLEKFWGQDQRLFVNGAVPIMKKHRGFIRAMLLGKPGSGQRIAFTVWKDEETYKSFANHPDLKKIVDMFSHMYVRGEEPKPSQYEVRAKSET